MTLQPVPQDGVIGDELTNARIEATGVGVVQTSRDNVHGVL